MRENIYQDKRYVGNFEIDGSDLPGTILYNRGNGVIMLDLRQEVSGFGKAFGKTRYIKGKPGSDYYDNGVDGSCSE